MITAKFTLKPQIRAKFSFPGAQVVSADLSTINTAIDTLNGEVLPGQAVDKLAVTSATKSALKAAIEGKNINIPSGTVFSAYPGLIGDILQNDVAPINDAIDAVNGEIVAGDALAKLSVTTSTKAAIESAIEEKDVDVPTATKFSDYPTKIRQILKSIGTAAISDVLSSKTFSNSSASGIAGTMPDIGQQNITPSASNQSISAGHHDGSGVVFGDAGLVSANIKKNINIFGIEGSTTVVDTNDATAISSDIKLNKTAYVDGNLITGSYETPTSSYIRPSDWLILPEVLETDQKLVALFAVHESGRNLVAFQIRGAYTVAWGDGIIENFADNAIATHNYLWENVGAETLCSRGYRQAVMTITPQSGQNITSFNIVQFPTTPRPSYVGYHFLDIVLSFPNATSFGLGYTATTLGREYLKFLESFKMKSSFSNVASFAYLFSCQTSLQSVSLQSNANLTNITGIFYNCGALIFVGLFDTINVSTFYNMCYGCYSLRTLPLFDTRSVNNMSQMCGNCYSLIYLPLFNTISLTQTASMLSNCFGLVDVPQLNFSAITEATFMLTSNFSLKRFAPTTIKYSLSLANSAMEAPALIEVFNNLATTTGQTITITSCPGATLLTAADRLIATSKGWTIAG